jgi:hypothetical protein
MPLTFSIKAYKELKLLIFTISDFICSSCNIFLTKIILIRIRSSISLKSHIKVQNPVLKWQWCSFYPKFCNYKHIVCSEVWYKVVFQWYRLYSTLHRFSTYYIRTQTLKQNSHKPSFPLGSSIFNQNFRLFYQHFFFKIIAIHGSNYWKQDDIPVASQKWTRGMFWSLIQVQLFLDNLK